MNRNIDMDGRQYQLAEKLKDRFSGRGAAISGMQASSTRELMDRAQRGYDPRVNCSELAFRENIRARNAASSGTAYQQGMRNETQYGARVNKGAYGNVRTGDNDSAAYVPRENQTDRPERSGYTANRARYAERNGNIGEAHTRYEPHSGKNSVKNTKSKKPKSVKAKKSNPEIESEAVREIRETKPEGRRLTPMFTVCLLLGTMMLMGIVLSFSEIYQTSSEIARLENQLEELNDTASELKLKLEEKNDIRVIEKIATEELGMVKEDSVQRKYLSLSDGERIDIVENDDSEDNTVGASGVLLSSILSSLDNIFDYFR